MSKKGCGDWGCGSGVERKRAVGRGCGIGQVMRDCGGDRIGDWGLGIGSAGRGGDIDKHKLPGIISASVLGAILGHCFDVWGIGVLGIGYQ